MHDECGEMLSYSEMPRWTDRMLSLEPSAGELSDAYFRSQLRLIPDVNCTGPLNGTQSSWLHSYSRILSLCAPELVLFEIDYFALSLLYYATQILLSCPSYAINWETIETEKKEDLLWMWSTSRCICHCFNQIPRLVLCYTLLYADSTAVSVKNLIVLVLAVKLGD